MTNRSELLRGLAVASHDRVHEMARELIREGEPGLAAELYVLRVGLHSGELSVDAFDPPMFDDDPTDEPPLTLIDD